MYKYLELVDGRHLGLHTSFHIVCTHLSWLENMAQAKVCISISLVSDFAVVRISPILARITKYYANNINQ